MNMPLHHGRLPSSSEADLSEQVESSRDIQGMFPRSTEVLNIQAHSDVHQLDRRLPASLSGSVRGNRAPIPAALDLSPQSGRDRNEQPRRVSRPLPVPPRSHQLSDIPNAFHRAPLSAVGGSDTYRYGGMPNFGMLESDSKHSNFPVTPEMSQGSFSPGSPVDPEAIDRRALIGVGELSTPRWTESHPRSSSTDVPSVPPSRQFLSSSTAVIGAEFQANIPSGERLAAPPSQPKYTSIGTVPEFSFDNTMTAALADSLSVPNNGARPVDSQSRPSPPLPASNTVQLSPNTARARIYARRQSRQVQMSSLSDLVPSPSKSAPSYAISSEVPGRKDHRKTPPQPTSRLRSSPNSSHEILKQFAPKDFSHLPPSPSSASINQFLRGSGSVGNFMVNNDPPQNVHSYTTSASMGNFAPMASPAKAHPMSPRVMDDMERSEALRKLDGLSSTPGRKTPKTKPFAPGVSSRPGTPASKNKPTIPSAEKGKSANVEGSPLEQWVDLAAELPIMTLSSLVNPPSKDDNPREFSPSTSDAITPTSRNSTSGPTTSTTPSSSGKDKSAHRASVGSELSSHGETESAAITVPPVPPLPKNFSNARPHAHNLEGTDLPSPGSVPSENGRPRQMNKKWSFSSALNLRLNKDSSPSTSPGLHEGIRTPPVNQSDKDQSASDGGSGTSTTPVGAVSAPLHKAGPPSKRLTPSSIPFFRRTSSSSISQTQSISMPPPVSTTRNVSNGSVRKSVLGMSIPSMLRTQSKRVVTQQGSSAYQPIVDIRAESPRFASTGWSGRKRGQVGDTQTELTQTLSVSGDAILKADVPLKTMESSKSGMDSRSSSDRSVATIQSRLPPITASPALRQPSSSASLRDSQSVTATPTRIPRLKPTESPRSNAATGTHDRLGASSKRTTSNSISEFGSLHSLHSTPRQQVTSGSHRSHLLAPMSARLDAKRLERPQEISARHASTQMVPPSRRGVPIASSSVAAPTASSIAKRSSREIRPAARVGTSSGSQTPRETVSPIKPSKSLHNKLSATGSSRLPTSSSMGAPTSRKSSLVVDSPRSSPIEDDETQADLEMAAYIKRRQTRHVNGKKEDLSDINGFPEDIPPSQPMTQREFISKRLATMSDHERQEVLDFDCIYYSPSSRIARSTNGETYNYGYDDERGDYIVVQNDHLSYRYQITGLLGKGSFGQVVRCRDHKTGGSVAIKIIRNKKRFHTQALVEVKILQQLVEWDPEDRHFMVRMTDHFYFRGHLCIVTEMLSINLYELIKANQFSGFSTVLIRRFTAQMLSSLQLMRSHRIVHCDLKPENILLCHPCKSRIKVIDFGSSCLETEKVYTYIQSRFYRSPEVILGMNYAMAIDMWSLGCILAELYTGVPIFPGENEHEQLACIMEVLGAPDRYIVDKASRKKLFFDATGQPRPFVNAKGKRRRPGAKSLSGVLKCDDEQFVDFISKCLTWDPDKRIKPQAALRHPWILAGRRRQAPAVPGSSRSSKLIGKSSLVISPPTPLIARGIQGMVPASVPRASYNVDANGSLSSRAGQTRNSAFPNQKT